MNIRIDDWERFIKISLTEKEDCYDHLNMENITNADYVLAKRICKDFKIEDFDECHDLYVQNDTLFATHSRTLEIYVLKLYELNSKKLLSTPGLAWQAAFKEIKIKLDLLNDNNILVIVDKGIKRGICHSIYRYGMSNEDFIKTIIKKVIQEIFWKLILNILEN